MAAFAKPRVTENAMTLDARWYTAPDVFTLEQRRIFATRWICVGRREQLQEPGSFFLAEVAGESLIVTCDKSRTLHAFYNVCRHRGTRICTEYAGRLGSSIQCPYHAWTYGLDGKLLAARNMDEVTGFNRTDYPLHEAAIALFQGFIFVNLHFEAAPFAQSFPMLDHRFDEWCVGELVTVRTITYELACNWKLAFLNYSECYHCPLVHPQLDKLSPSDSGRNDLCSGPVLGGYSDLRERGTSLTTTGTSSRPPIPTVSGENLQRVYYYTIFPSMLLSLHPDYAMVHYVHPLAADRTKIVCAWLFEPQTVNSPGFDPSDAVDFWDVTNRQDWRVNELTQQGLTSAAYTPGPYSNAEGLLSAFDAYYMEAMGG